MLVSAARRNELSSLTTNSESLREQVDTSLRQGYGLAGEWTLMGKRSSNHGWLESGKPEFQTTDDTDYTDENNDEDTKFARE